jgi:hypothetical protein
MRLALLQFSEIVKSCRIKEVKSGMEHRHSLRKSVQARVQVVPVESATPTPFTALLQDISLTGMGLLQSRPMEVGKRFVVLLPREGSEPLSIVCVSRFCCTLADGLYRIGAEFQQVLPKDTRGEEMKEEAVAAVAAAPGQQVDDANPQQEGKP